MTPDWVIFLFAFFQAIILLLPLLPVVLFWKNPAFRSIFRLWTLMAFFGLLCAPLQLLPVSAASLQAISHIGISLLIALGVILKKDQRIRLTRLTMLHLWNPSLIFTALFLAALFSYPWIVFGALGSLTDNLLQLTAGLSFGLMTATLCKVFLFDKLVLPATNNIGTFLLQGLSIGIALSILFAGMGFPFGAMQFLLMISLPSLGWVLTTIAQIAFRQQKSHLLAIGLLVGIAIAAPLILIDPDELGLLYNATPGEIMGYAIYASLISLVAGWLVGLIAFFISQVRLRRTIPSLPSTRTVLLLFASASAAWLLAITLYILVGQTGFHGESIFIILKSQADVSEAAQIEDASARRAFVYQSLTTHADQSQSEIQQFLDRFGFDYTPYYLVNAIQVTDNPLLRLWLLTRPEVDRVLSNPWMRPLPVEVFQNTGTADPPSSQLWNLEMINVYRVWAELGVSGKDIVVGQSDSGVQWDHPEVVSTYRGRTGDHNYNWLDPWYASPQPQDLNGHGTHTLGTILGATTGIAPNAAWFACANLARPLGNPALYLDCMQFMLAPYPQGDDPFTAGDPNLGANVINNSWGCPPIEGCDPDSLRIAVDNLRLSGIFVVASAGNDGPICNSLIHPIAIYDGSFTVGAINSAGQLALFSSLGPVELNGVQLIKPDIVAPGENVLSSTPGNTYEIHSGTSMAGPHVVGVVALMWSANPYLIGQIDLTEQIIIDTADPYSGTLPECPGAFNYPSTAVGYGVINAFAAVQAAQVILSP